MDKVLLSVAPVSASDSHIDPKKIAADVLACEKAGAAMVHLHVRDAGGRLTDDLSLFHETLERIREKSDIVIEASTGGVSGLTIDQRCAPLHDKLVECASLNVGSVNLGDAVYQNPIADVKTCVREILRTGKTPEVEVFEIGMIETTLRLSREFGMKDPLLFSIVLGQEGAAPATAEALFAMRSFIPGNMLWGITQAHRVKNDLLCAALGLGAKTVRVGFEDSDFIDEGRRAETNAPIVENTAKILSVLGKEPMTPAEAREAFRIGR
jgi:3-keto-5-aminohexanoate cleavage enzyme